MNVYHFNIYLLATLCIYSITNNAQICILKPTFYILMMVCGNNIDIMSDSEEEFVCRKAARYMIFQVISYIEIKFYLLMHQIKMKTQFKIHDVFWWSSQLFMSTTMICILLKLCM